MLAGLLKIFPSKHYVTFTIIACKNLVLILTGLLLYVVVKKTRLRLNPVWVLFLYCLWLLANFRWFFQFSHDGWLLLFFMNVVFVSAVSLARYPWGIKSACAWGGLGGLIILTSPIAGLVWIVLSLGMLKQNTQRILLAFFIVGVCAFPWVLRNYLVFDKVILMKSNFFYDAYHNNQAVDGIVNDTYELKNHPYCTLWKDPDSLYARVGESAFLDVYRVKFMQDLKENPEKYLRNIKNRLFAALFRFYPYTEHELFVPLQAFCHALPFLGIIVLLALRRVGDNPYIRVALIMYAAYLAPYIIVSYYMRYAIPLTQVKILFIFWAIDQGAARFFPKPEPR
jgi:hypothetical protein